MTQVIVVAALPLFGVSFFLAISWLLALFSGWQDVATVYDTSAQHTGETWNFRSAKIGLVNYNNCLRFVANADGLRISVLPLFRFGHRPVFVPWSEVTFTTENGWFVNYASLHFRQAASVRFRIKRTLVHEFASASKGQFTARPDAA